MKAATAAIVFVLSTLPYGNSARACESSFLWLGSEGVSFSSLLGEHLNKHQTEPIKILFRDLPEQTILHLVAYSKTESLPFISRQFALETAYALALANQNLSPWLIDDLTFVATTHIDDYMRQQRLRLEGVLPEEFKPSVTLSNELASPWHKRFGTKVNSDLFILAERSMRWLAQMQTKKTIFLDKLAIFSELFSNMLTKHTTRLDSTVRQDIIEEFYTLVSALGEDSSPDMAVDALGVFAAYPPAIELAFWYVREINDINTLIKNFSSKQQFAVSLDQNIADFLQMRLNAIESCSDDSLTKDANSMLYLRLLTRSESAAQLIMTRISEILFSTKDRPMMKSEAYQLYILILELKMRAERGAVTKVTIDLMRRLISALYSEVKANYVREDVEASKTTLSNFSPSNLLNEVLRITDPQLKIWHELKQDSDIIAMIKDIATDAGHPENIFGSVNRSQAIALLNQIL